MKVKKMVISDLHEDPSNVRKHSKKNLDAIKASLRKFGQQKPIVIDDKNIVIAGNGTLRAAKEEGWNEINVVVTELKGSDLIAYGIADNRTGELAGWSEDLSNILKGLDTEMDLTDIGFDDKDLEKLFGPKDGLGGSGEKLPEEYLIVIECDSEKHQEDLFEELTSKGLKCKIMQ